MSKKDAFGTKELKFNHNKIISSSLEKEIRKLQDILLGNINQKTYSSIVKTIEVLKSSYISQNFLQVGDQAPNFVLPNALGEKFELKQLVKKGKVIISFIRGGWCPYCYLELRALQKYLKQFQELGVTVIAISSERADYCLNTMERNGLQFEVLSDKANKVAQQYKLVYKSESDIDLLGELGLNEAVSRGDLSYELPVPATFIIDEWMTVRYAFTEPDYRKRAEPDELLFRLTQMK